MSPARRLQSDGYLSPADKTQATLSHTRIKLHVIVTDKGALYGLTPALIHLDVVSFVSRGTPAGTRYSFLIFYNFCFIEAWRGSKPNPKGSFNRFTTSASTFSKTPASYVSSSLTTKVSLLKSAADVVKCTDVDYATGSFCSSCSIPPPITGGLWSTGKGCAMCDYDYNDNYGG